MRTLVMSNAGNTFYVTMKVAMVSDTVNNFTILSIENVNTQAELLTGIQTIFKVGLNYNMKRFVDYCTVNTLTLKMIKNGAGVGTTTTILP